jgi:hypothetical protein
MFGYRTMRPSTRNIIHITSILMFYTQNQTPTAESHVDNTYENTRCPLCIRLGDEDSKLSEKAMLPQPCKFPDKTYCHSRASILKKQYCHNRTSFLASQCCHSPTSFLTRQYCHSRASFLTRQYCQSHASFLKRYIVTAVQVS